MNVISVAGFKDTGKSTLCRALIAGLRQRGMKVGYIKRTSEAAFSAENTDSGSVLAQGVDALLWGGGYARLESRVGSNDPIQIACRFFPDCDIVIMEGGKELPLPKIWVLEEGEEKPDYPGIFACYDRFGKGDGAARYGGDETGRLAEDLAALVAARLRSARAYVDGRELPMKDFVADFLRGGVVGMLSSLKGFDKGDISVFISSAEKQD